MSDWTKEINDEAIKENLQAIDVVDDENPDLVKLISASGLSAEELATGILSSPPSEQKALVSAISRDRRLCAQLRFEQKQWREMKPQDRFHFLVSLHHDVRCIILESTDLRKWSSAKIQEVIALLGVRYIETARRVADLLSWLRVRRNDTFHKALTNVVSEAIDKPVHKTLLRKSIRQRRACAVARAFYYSRTKGFDKPPSGQEVAKWIADTGKTVFPLVRSPYRRILVAYVDVPESKQFIEAMWLDLGPDDHFFVVTNELSPVEKQGRIQHEFRHFCESAFIKTIGE